LKIFGANVDTGDIKLKSSDKTFNKFEKGRVDLFNVEQEDWKGMLIDGDD
jgi:hypothetical protein